MPDELKPVGRQRSKRLVTLSIAAHRENPVAHPGRSSHRKTDRTQLSKQRLRVLVSLTKRAPRHNQRFAEELLRIRLLVAPREQDGQVERQDQRLLVICAEQADR